MLSPLGSNPGFSGGPHAGENIPVNELDENVVEMYIEDMRAKCEETFIPFKNVCKRKSVEIVVLEGDNPMTTLLKYVAQAGINSLVLGSSSPSYFGRRRKDGGVPISNSQACSQVF